MNDLGTLLVAGPGAAVAYGAGGFSGGIATKRNPVTRVVALAHILSLVVFVGLAVGTGEAWPRPADLLWGALAGVGVEAFFVCLGQTQAGAVFWPIVMARLVSASVMLALALRGPGLRPQVAVPTLLSALLNALGTVLFMVAAQTGRVAEASVLLNVYPAFTVVLALLVLRERLRVDQWWGLAATLLAVPLIAARL